MCRRRLSSPEAFELVFFLWKLSDATFLGATQQCRMQMKCTYSFRCLGEWRGAGEMEG